MLSKSLLSSLTKRIVAVLLMPFYLQVSLRSNNFVINIQNTIIDFSNLYGISFVSNVSNFYEILTLILVVVPSIYFFIRKQEISDEEDLISLAFVCTIATVVLHSLINMFPPIDVSAEIYLSAQRIPFLGSFSTMVIIALILYPTLKTLIPDNDKKYAGKHFRRIRRYFGNHYALSIFLVFLILPDYITISSFSFVQQAYQTINFTASGWSVGIESLLSSTINLSQLTVVFFPFIGLPLGVYRWSTILIFLYISRTTNPENIHKKKYIFFGLVCLAPYLFFGIFSIVYALLLGQPSFAFPIPLPILVGIAFVVAKTSSKESDEKSKKEDEKRKEHDKVKVPIFYMVYWKIRERIGGD